MVEIVAAEPQENSKSNPTPKKSDALEGKQTPMKSHCLNNESIRKRDSSGSLLGKRKLEERAQREDGSGVDEKTLFQPRTSDHTGSS